MRGEGSIVGTLGFMLFGPIVWAVHLLVAYGGHASLCAVPGAPVGALPWILGGATLAAAVTLILGLAAPELVRRPLRAARPGSEQARFATTVMRLLSLLSLFGVLFAGIVMLVLPLCQQAR